jgi:hypothetical protein
MRRDCHPGCRAQRTPDARVRLLPCLVAEVDRPKLEELPDQPYVFARWKRRRVAPDYHFEVDGQWYSTPDRLAGLFGSTGMVVGPWRGLLR